MKRRDFMILTGATAIWSRVARAQQATIPVVGFLSGRSPGEAATVLGTFRQGLGEAGYFEGKNVTVEYRWAEGRYDRLPALAAELVRRQVAVIAATGGDVSGPAAKAATTTIPIVFTAGGDPVKLGLVESLSRPGGNVTGVTLFFEALGAKRLELLRELIANATAISMLVNPDNPTSSTDAKGVKAGAISLGTHIDIVNARTESDIEDAFAVMARQRAAGVLVDDPFLLGQRDQLVRLAARHAIPTIYFSREFVDAGGLMSYGTSIANGYRQAGIYTGRILDGVRPTDLPVMIPTNFVLIINLRTAKALGLEIPGSLLARADEVIE